MIYKTKEEDVGRLQLTPSTLSGRQSTEMDEVMHQLGNTLSDQDVNAVASQHFDAQQVIKELVFGAAASLVNNVLIHLGNVLQDLSSKVSCSLVLLEGHSFRVLWCLTLSVLGRCWKTSGPAN